jgi:Mg-chelatase subunit ChlD
MSTTHASSKGPVRRGEFTRSLSRQVAARGRLDPVYRDLSDHWTLIIQNLYPVWVVIGPGLASPGMIDLRSRSVYLDSEELLGTREDITTGSLDRYRVLVCFGVAFHEVMHAKHTKLWVTDYDQQLASEGKTQLAEDRRLLEEPRMEAHGMRDHPAGSVRGTFIRRALSAAVTAVLLPRFITQVAQTAAAGSPLTRDMCARAMSYLAARTHYGIVDPATLTGLQELWERVLGAGDVKALHDLYARVIWIGDGELEQLDTAATEYRAIVGPPDPAPSPSSQEADDGETQPGDGSPSQKGTAPDGRPGQARTQAGTSEASELEDEPDTPTCGSLADALKDAADAARDGQLEQLDEDVSLTDTLAQAEAQPVSQNTAGTGAPSGRMPKRAVNRPPLPDEIRAAQRFASRLEQARTQALAHVGKRTPGGRFHPREHMRAIAQRQHRRPVTAHSWSLQRTLRNPLQGPHVIFIIDTSGSMKIYEYALGPIVWIIDTAIRMVGGRMASGLFGDSAELLSDGRSAMRLVPGIRTGGGTAFAGDAIEMCAEQLEMENHSRPRLAYILSDSGWYDTKAGMEKIQWLAKLGVPTIHLAMLHPPLSVLASRISVISDPADALAVVAADTVLALQTPPAALLARIGTPAA